MLIHVAVAEESQAENRPRRLDHHVLFFSPHSWRFILILDGVVPCHPSTNIKEVN